MGIPFIYTCMIISLLTPLRVCLSTPILGYLFVCANTWLIHMSTYVYSYHCMSLHPCANIQKYMCIYIHVHIYAYIRKIHIIFMKTIYEIPCKPTMKNIHMVGSHGTSYLLFIYIIMYGVGFHGISYNFCSMHLPQSIAHTEYIHIEYIYTSIAYDENTHGNV